jgi:hypothetical protein
MKKSMDKESVGRGPKLTMAVTRKRYGRVGVRLKVVAT